MACCWNKQPMTKTNRGIIKNLHIRPWSVLSAWARSWPTGWCHGRFHWWVWPPPHRKTSSDERSSCSWVGWPSGRTGWPTWASWLWLRGWWWWWQKLNLRTPLKVAPPLEKLLPQPLSGGRDGVGCPGKTDPNLTREFQNQSVMGKLRLSLYLDLLRSLKRTFFETKIKS